MPLLALLSTTAIVVGLAAVLPQLANVNYAGYHATVLALGNVVSVALCLAAVALVWRFGDRAPAQAEVGVYDLPTGELLTLRDALEHEARRRAPELATA
jgi:hypothetical protein